MGPAETLRQWLEWRERARHPPRLQYLRGQPRSSDFPDLVERMCRALEVPTDRLVLELTEGATQPLVKLMDTLTRFRIKGIGLAHRRFRRRLFDPDAAPPAALHRDQDRPLLRRDATDVERQRADRQKHHRPGPWLGLTVTAEGVETEQQLMLLRDLGATSAQGYLRPLQPAAIPSELDQFEERFAQRSA